MTAQITENDARYAYNLVKRICDQVGPGVPASPQEHDRAMMIKEEMVTLLGEENVTVENFSLSPGAFLGWLKISAVFTLAATLVNMTAGRVPGIPLSVSALTALILAVVAILPGIFEFMIYYEFFDPFFPKKKSINVIGRFRNPATSESKDIRRVLILGGHHDSALEMTWLHLLGYGDYLAMATLFIGFGLLLVLTLLQFGGAVTDNASLVESGRIGWILLMAKKCCLPKAIIRVATYRVGVSFFLP